MERGSDPVYDAVWAGTWRLRRDASEAVGVSQVPAVRDLVRMQTAWAKGKVGAERGDR